MNKYERLYTTALKSADEGGLDKTMEWIQKYRQGDCSIYVAVLNILVALQLIPSPDAVRKFNTSTVQMLHEYWYQLSIAYQKSFFKHKS